MIGENATFITCNFACLYQTHAFPIPNIWIVKATNKSL